MTRDDIIRMAQESGLPVPVFPGSDIDLLMLQAFEHFAALVAAAEREACAQVAENMLRFYTQTLTGVPQVIRARGQS